MQLARTGLSAWEWPRRDADMRRKLSAQIDSVLQKGLPYRLHTALVEDHGLPAEAASAVAATCTKIVWLRAGERAPGQVWLPVPEGLGPGSRRYAGRLLRRVLVTPVDEDDLLVWFESGLGGLQRARLLRTLEQAERQGGQFQLRELAALHNLTVNAAKERLRELREAGVRLPYHGRSHAQRKSERLGRLWFAVERVLEGAPPVDVCELTGLSSRRLEEVVQWWARTVAARAHAGAAAVAAREGLSVAEVDEAMLVAETHRGVTVALGEPDELPPDLWPLRAHTVDGTPAELERRLSEYLHRRHGWSARRVGLLTALLRTSTSIYQMTRRDDEVLYEAVTDGEPLGRPLRDCAVETVRLQLATPEEGVGGERPDRITDVKRTKIERYTAQASAQATFLTNADLCYLLGVHTDVVSRLLHEPWAHTIPTRQREWERRMLWLARLVDTAEQTLRGRPLADVCRGAELPLEGIAKELRTLTDVAQDIEMGSAANDIVRHRGVPRWLVDRLTQHSSLTLLARAGRKPVLQMAV